jgi:hypothetical protein
LSAVCDQIRGPLSPTSAPPLGSDYGRHLEGLGREDRSHLGVIGLVPANARVAKIFAKSRR